MATSTVFQPGKWASRLFDAAWSCEIQPEYTTFRFDDGRHLSFETTAVYNGSIRWHMLFWRALSIHTPAGIHTFVGLSPRTARQLTKTIKALLIERFGELKAAVTALHDEYTRLYQGDFYIRSYVANRFLSDNRLAFDKANACQKLLTEASFINADATFSAAAKALTDFCKDPMRLLHERNEDFVQIELSQPKWQNFFDTVEKSPLTPQQQRSVICHEDRNLLVACAGSGKTSTLVAKVAYSIQKLYVEPRVVLALAFNAKAAKEMADRLSERVGIKIEAKTFHSFGRSVISACGQPARPNIRASRLLINIVADLKTSNPAFNAKWLEFKAVYWIDEPESDDADYDDIVKAHGQVRRSDKNWGLPTLKGELVASFQELSIANWLYINGIDYQYEQPYSAHPLPSGWDKYEPDFTYTFADGSHLYHEHFAVDAHGQSPFGEKYLASLSAKRGLHAQNQTPLIETSSAQIYDGTVFTHLEQCLSQYGIQRNPIAPAELEAKLKARPDTDLITLLLTVLNHAKESGASIDDLRRKASTLTNKARAHAFLNILHTVWEAYEQRLTALSSIDFAGMIRQAADLIESKAYKSRYKLILVDEFQDISPGRSRLIRSLLDSQPDAVLFAVGDDWQAINRFAGSDLSIMQNFSSIFGQTSQNKLERTFRSNQGISETASRFVSKNPLQIAKIVTSTNPATQAVIDVIPYRTSEDQLSIVEATLERLSQQSLKARKPTTVLLIGRYQYKTTGPFSTKVVQRWKDAYPGVQVLTDDSGEPFDTIHKTKGLEADTVIVHSLQADFYGFPNSMEDDPLLRLIQSEKEAFPNAEERRLFYVALTRAKHKVILLSSEDRPSRFVVELIRDDHDGAITFDGSQQKPKPCAQCKRGFLVLKKSTHGQFMGCNQYRFTKCTYKERV